MAETPAATTRQENERRFLDQRRRYNDGLPDSVDVNMVGLTVLQMALGHAEEEAKEEVGRQRRRRSGPQRRLPTIRRPRSFAIPMASNLQRNPNRLGSALQAYDVARARVNSIVHLREKVSHALTVRIGGDEGWRAFREYMEEQCPVTNILGVMDSAAAHSAWKKMKAESLVCEKAFEVLQYQRQRGREQRLKFAREEFGQLLREWDLPTRNKKWKDTGLMLVSVCSQTWENLANEFSPDIFRLVRGLRKELEGMATNFSFADAIELDVDFMRDLGGHST